MSVPHTQLEAAKKQQEENRIALLQVTSTPAAVMVKQGHDDHDEQEDERKEGQGELSLAADVDMAALQKADDDRLSLAEKNKRMQQQLRVSLPCMTGRWGGGGGGEAPATVLHLCT